MQGLTILRKAKPFYSGQRERAWVAVGYNPRVLGHHFGAERADRPAARHVLVVNQLGLPIESVLQLVH